MSDVKKNIKEIEENLNLILDGFNLNDLEAKPEMLSKMEQMNVAIYDYDKEIEILKIDAKNTLSCLANLYLKEDLLINKNISEIIKNDSLAISDLNFSIFCSKRALKTCMNQLDMGSTNPEMFEAVAMFQKEMRETIKSIHDLLHVKMKDFYKNLKGELDDLNTGENILLEDNLNIQNNTTTIIDTKEFNKLLEQYKKDPTLLKEEEKKKNQTIPKEEEKQKKKK